VRRYRRIRERHQVQPLVIHKLLHYFLFVLYYSQLAARWPDKKKSELMRMRRERAYSSCCSQIVLVYLHPFRRNSLLKSACSVACTNCKKTLKPPIFGGLRLFKVIDVNTTKKLVTIACYDKQHVCAYLQPFSR